MAKERLKSPRARLFVALDLPDPVRDGLAAWQVGALADPALRMVGAEALHVTLCFLGYHRERDIERIAAIVTDVEPRFVEIRLDPEPVPIPRRRPRLFAVGGESPVATALQAELSDRLQAERFYKPEKRPFWTHVTVARVRPEKGSRKGGRRGNPRPVERPPGPLPEELLKPFGGARVALYRSFLRPSGAEYVRLAELNLAFAD
jgi:RNA 2',3'-cyclic 3'-phosphodiesterase